MLSALLCALMIPAWCIGLTHGNSYAPNGCCSPTAASLSRGHMLSNVLLAVTGFYETNLCHSRARLFSRQQQLSASQQWLTAISMLLYQHVVLVSNSLSCQSVSCTVKATASAGLKPHQWWAAQCSASRAMVGGIISEGVSLPVKRPPRVGGDAMDLQQLPQQQPVQQMQQPQQVKTRSPTPPCHSLVTNNPE